MPELLFLAHRIPYPPDKGDKIRSWHFLQFLSRRYRVHLGCFIDDPNDWQHEAFLRSVCEECCFVPLNRRRARWRSLQALMTGGPMTVPYYRDGTLDAWVRDLVGRRNLDRAFIFSSAMAQYVGRREYPTLRRIMDFVDVDSEKWFDYAKKMRWPKSWIFRREGRTLRQFERAVAAEVDQILLCTAAEADLFRSFAPGVAARVNYVPNGVDCDYFSPDREYPNPYDAAGPVLVFTGAMDYWANVDAVTFFAGHVLPLVRKRLSGARFYIVGSNPTSEVRALANGSDVVVAGRVPDVRPYLAYARVVVAPLRIARGIQNKVLEGMAMGKVVVASPQAMEGIDAEAMREILIADGAEAFAESVCRAAAGDADPQIGRNARNRIVADWDWSTSLGKLATFVDG
jgi:sugar transferase (PEP-CTERM/EpsH1 system associated)